MSTSLTGEWLLFMDIHYIFAVRVRITQWNAFIRNLHEIPQSKIFKLLVIDVIDVIFNLIMQNMQNQVFLQRLTKNLIFPFLKTSCQST